MMIMVMMVVGRIQSWIPASRLSCIPFSHLLECLSSLHLPLPTTLHFLPWLYSLAHLFSSASLNRIYSASEFYSIVPCFSVSRFIHSYYSHTNNCRRIMTWTPDPCILSDTKWIDNSAWLISWYRDTIYILKRSMPVCVFLPICVSMRGIMLGLNGQNS